MILKDIFLLEVKVNMLSQELWKIIKKVLRECGIKNITFHALRHTFATRCIEAGVDVKSLSEMLGHASVNITMNRYVHPSMEMKRKNIEKYSALFAVK